MKSAQRKKAINNITAKVEEINPEYALKLASKNKNNRPVRRKTVLTFARAMKCGHWACNGQGIILDKDGNILDGQHRLYAIIESGETIAMLIVRGVDKADYNTMDIGNIKNNSDFLAVNKQANPKILSSTIKNVSLYQGGFGRQMGGSGAHSAFTPRMMEEALDENKKIVDSVSFAMGNWKGTPLPHTAIATLHYIFTQIDAKLGNEFMEKLANGNIAELSSPILKLRNFLYQRKAELKSRGIAMHRSHQFGIAIKAWNAWINGKTISEFDLKKGEEFPKALKPKK